MSPTKPVDEYFASLQGEHQAVALRFRNLIREAVPDAREEFKWNRPCYSTTSLLCYIQSTKNHVKLGFQKGSSLSDPDKLLEGTGKDMRHYAARTVADVQKAPVKRWLKQASRLA